MGEGDAVGIGNCRGIDASMQELIDECLIVISTHTRPTSALHLGVENCYQLRNLHVCELQGIANVINVILHNFLFLKFNN